MAIVWWSWNLMLRYKLTDSRGIMGFIWFSRLDD